MEQRSIVDNIINEINKEQISKGRTLALYEMRPIIEKYILTNKRESENID